MRPFGTSWPDRTVRLRRRSGITFEPRRNVDGNVRHGIVLDAREPWPLTADDNPGSA